MNNVTIIGRVGNDPELRYTPKGTPICELRVGVPTSESDGTAWITVTTWAATAEAVVQYVGKGREIGVTGELRSNNWTDNEGNKHQRVTISARKVDFLREPKGDNEDAPAEVSTPEEAFA